MGHYAKVINEIVVQVCSASQEWVNKQPDKDLWYETSYNIGAGIYYDQATGQPHKDQSLATATLGRKRKNYAAIGYRYDKQRDAFIPPNDYAGWILNEETCLWESPIPHPNDDKLYTWNNHIQNWELVKTEN